MIWNYLSNQALFDPTTDIDVIFEPKISYDATQEIEKSIETLLIPNYAWEVRTKLTCTCIIRIHHPILVRVMLCLNFPKDVPLLVRA